MNKNTLMDYNTAEPIGPATPAQVQHAATLEAAGDEQGVFLIDSDGDVTADAYDDASEQSRRVYVDGPL